MDEIRERILETFDFVQALFAAGSQFVIDLIRQYIIEWL